MLRRTMLTVAIVALFVRLVLSYHELRLTE